MLNVRGVYIYYYIYISYIPSTLNNQFSMVNGCLVISNHFQSKDLESSSKLKEPFTIGCLEYQVHIYTWNPKAKHFLLATFQLDDGSQIFTLENAWKSPNIHFLMVVWGSRYIYIYTQQTCIFSVCVNPKTRFFFPVCVKRRKSQGGWSVSPSWERRSYDGKSSPSSHHFSEIFSKHIFPHFWRNQPNLYYLVTTNDKLGGGNSNIFLFSSRTLGKMNPI